MTGDKDLVSIQYHANQLSAAAICAYWDNRSHDFHVKQIKDQMAKLNELLEALK